VWAQFDGEPVIVPAGSTVSIAINRRPFYAVASSLRPSFDRAALSRRRRAWQMLKQAWHGLR
jgi:hypothetical protein